MRLEDAATYFDTCPVVDGYTLAPLWDCQFSSFNDTNAVGSTSTRRTLSIAPGLALPARRVVKIFDDRWIIGDGNPDEWQGGQIRQGFNMRKATDLTAILTPAQACLGSAGTPAYSQKLYFKDMVNASTDEVYDVFWNVFFAPDEPLTKGGFLRNGTTLYRIRGLYLPHGDLRIAQADELDVVPATATFATGAIDEVTEARAAGTTSASVILLDFNKAYDYQTEADPKAQAGDMAMLVAVSALAAPTVNDRVTLGSRTWLVLNTVQQQDAWLLHVRRD